MRDRIEKTVELKAPAARVWRAVTDHREFGEWFRVELEGTFVVGGVSRGRVTYPGYEHLKWEATVQTMEPERLFAFRWCPLAVDPDVDLSNDPTTLVEFRLEPSSDGTRLVISESGFNSLPEDHRRAEAFERNSRGWEEQTKNITRHVES